LLDPITLDQLRMLEAVVETGSFSAAARKVGRVQSAVSTAMTNLEAQLGVALWDRSERRPVLTQDGKALLAMATRVLVDVDALKRVAAGLVRGIESQVSLCVDALFPLDALVDACTGFAIEFPNVELRLDVQTMSGVIERIVDGSATLGVAMTALAQAANLDSRALAPIRMVPVVASRHPLAAVAAHRGRVPHSELADHVQIVLSERATSATPDRAVLSMRTWRVLDLPTKHALLVAGLGWGNLPLHLAKKDLARGKLVKLRTQGWADDEHTVHLSAVQKRSTPPGPAHRWLTETLATLCVRETGATRSARARR
jgi:DNA-binding transcriptional LysR family regulator